jgi:hypothetical protein
MDSIVQITERRFSQVCSFSLNGRCGSRCYSNRSNQIKILLHQYKKGLGSRETNASPHAGSTRTSTAVGPELVAWEWETWAEDVFYLAFMGQLSRNGTVGHHCLRRSCSSLLAFGRMSCPFFVFVCCFAQGFKLRFPCLSFASAVNNSSFPLSLFPSCTSIFYTYAKLSARVTRGNQSMYCA